MEYWRGYMNWHLDSDWSCDVCGNKDLTWGLVQAQCRCDTCHTHYNMRDLDTKEVVTKPIWMIKPDYAEAVRKHWATHHRPIEEMELG